LAFEGDAGAHASGHGEEEADLVAAGVES
jgi:hypothetical protein